MKEHTEKFIINITTSERLTDDESFESVIFLQKILNGYVDAIQPKCLDNASCTISSTRIIEL